MLGACMPSVDPPQVIVDDGDRERSWSGPVATVRANTPADIGTAFAKIESALASGHHVGGYFSYELGYALERRLLPLMPSCKMPLLWFGIFENSVAPAAGVDQTRSRAYAGPLRHDWSAQNHADAFARVHALIAAGDLYQANLTYRARFAFGGDPLALYRRLRARAGARHCAYVDDGERQLLSFSPELFFEISPEGIIRARPMKGTAARGETPNEDQAARARLATNEKERAENLMIVDLLRNDLSRVSQPGSVRVETLFEVETYPTVHQMVSSISARLEPGAGVERIVRALFPCGSVTGAPKLRAMEVIREVETDARGIYCGAIGWFAPDGRAAFNVAIRTLMITGGGGEVGIGGGIVFDSRAEPEYEECRIKARFYEAGRPEIRLIETLRYAPAAGFVRGERHLARMAASAAALGLPFDQAAAWAALRACTKGAEGSLRIRLTLGEDGAFEAAAEPFSGSFTSWRFAVSPERVWSGDPLLRHKTSIRELYDGEHTRLVKETGCDEVLFLNERGELTEGSRTNIFVQKEGGLLTPPVASGLLDGCLRRELIEQGRCLEAVLRPDDLARAEQIFLGNSLRGLIPAVAV
jgi:para-aminobenzoate synthetase/4-amino-4-deoxychorismate lyase